MKRLLLRADDLGYSEGVNYGIAKSVIDGIIGNVGIMTNMPAVEHGLKLLSGANVCLGQHTNICIGNPLTDPALIPSITNSKGEFRASSEYREAKEDFVVLDEVILEIEAQYKHFIGLTGQKPSYFDGHAVSSANFFKGLERVAAKYDLKYSAFPLQGSININKKVIQVSMEAMEPGYDPLEALQRTMRQGEEESYTIFVCHPGYLDGYLLKHSSLTLPRPLEVDMLCDPATMLWIEDHGIQLITYDQL